MRATCGGWFMGRRVLAAVGAVLGVLGLLAGAAALALPWARYRVRGNVFGAGGLSRDGAWQVYQLDLGEVYVVGLLLLAGLLAAGGLAGGSARTVTGIVAPILGLVTAMLVIYLVNRATVPHQVQAAGFANLNVDPRAAAGAGFGLAATALLGFGAGLLALGRTPGGPVGPEPPGERRRRQPRTKASAAAAPVRSIAVLLSTGLGTLPGKTM